jgi:hypothetical protein
MRSAWLCMGVLRVCAWRAAGLPCQSPMLIDGAGIASLTIFLLHELRSNSTTRKAGVQQSRTCVAPSSSDLRLDTSSCEALAEYALRSVSSAVTPAVLSMPARPSAQSRSTWRAAMTTFMVLASSILLLFELIACQLFCMGEGR